MAPEPPLRIIIIGAGLGGCTAAFCFAMNGHHVKVFEQRSSLSPKGNGIMIRPPASKALQSWGLGPDFEAISDTSPTTLFRNLRTGKLITRSVAIDIADYPDWGTDRQAAQQLLYNRACDAGADIEFEASVHDVRDSVDSASVTLKDGNIHQADLVLAADGIRSSIRSRILSDLEEPIDPIISKITFYGVRIPLQDLRSIPDAKALIDTVTLNVWAGTNLQVVTRASNKLDTFGAHFGIVSDHTAQQEALWDEDGDMEYVKKTFATAHPTLRTALSSGTGCDRWKLAELPKLSRWTSLNGRIALLGDSAHAMLPNAAQGYSQIVEDIAVLDYLISARRSTGIQAVTNLWQALRIPRVDKIKEFAAWNTRVSMGEEPHSPSAHKSVGDTTQPSAFIKSLKSIIPNPSAPFHTAAFLKWVHDYDAVDEAKRYLERMKPKI